MAATLAMAFSNAGRVRMSRGFTMRFRTSITILPHSKAASSFSGSRAGMLLNPMGERPMNSITVDMVLAVNCPPQAPAPGQAWSSRSFNSALVISPAALAPTPSKTSPTVTSRA